MLFTEMIVCVGSALTRTIRYLSEIVVSQNFGILTMYEKRLWLSVHTTVLQQWDNIARQHSMFEEVDSKIWIVMCNNIMY